MRDDHDLKQLLSKIDGRGYKAYKEIKGAYAFSEFTLYIDHVQGDPFATPSRVRVRVDRRASGFGPQTTTNVSRRTALCDFLTRAFYASCKAIARGSRGTGKSGMLTIDRPRQEILERTAMAVDEQSIEARFFMGLPATGRKISGRQAAAMFFQELPKIVTSSLFFGSLDMDQLFQHIETAEDADALRKTLADLELVGFVGNGSLLPRASGIDPEPLEAGKAIRFQSPPELQKAVTLPNQGIVIGMGIPRGVTLIVGGGFHGKSTLLKALELGIYNHLPGDGRELAVSLPLSVKIRAADGRHIAGVDISPFIGNLPFQRDTISFSTENASGSTSQAANIAEALETGAEVLLLDEDTSATNFMIRDHRMQKLVVKESEPITPFIDKVRQLYKDRGVSTVLVMGGSGDYFSVADHVIQMTGYQPADVTSHAHEIAKMYPSGRIEEGGGRFGDFRQRIPLIQSFNPYRGKNRLKIAAPRSTEIQFGRTAVDLGDLEQITDISQTRGMAHAMHYAMQYVDGSKTLVEIVELVLNDVEKKGLEILTPYLTGDIAAFRSIELAAAINRMRTLKVRQLSPFPE